MPEHKDAVTAIFGASAGLAGFMLVLFGLLTPVMVSLLQSFSRIERPTEAVARQGTDQPETGPVAAFHAMMRRRDAERQESAEDHTMQALANAGYLTVALAITFVWALVVVLLSLSWFLFPTDVLFWGAVVAFVVEVIGIMALGIAIIFSVAVDTPTLAGGHRA
jgi:hypothetical protein